MATITITKLTGHTTVVTTGLGLPQLTIPHGEVSFRTSHTNADGTPKDTDLLYIIWKAEQIPLNITSDSIIISDVTFSTSGTITELIASHDKAFPKAV